MQYDIEKNIYNFFIEKSSIKNLCESHDPIKLQILLFKKKFKSNPNIFFAMLMYS